MNIPLTRTQFRFLLFWTIMGTGILTMPFGIAHFTIHDGWLVPFMFYFGSLISVFVCLLFTRTFPMCTLTEGLEIAFGPWIGRILGGWIIIMMYLGMCMLMRELSLFVEINALPKTPLFIITAIIIAPLSYTALIGIHSLGRISEFLTPLAFVLGITILGLAMVKMDPTQLRPILEYGWRPVYRGGILPATGFAFQFILSLEFVKSLRTPNKISVDILTVASILTLLGFIVMAVIIGILGEAAAYLNYPVLEVVRSIRIGEFLERFDTIYGMGVVTTIIVKLGVWKHAWLMAIQRVARLPDYRSFAIAAASTVWAGSILLFHNAQQLAEFMLYVTPSYFGLSLVILPLLAVLAKNLRNLVDQRVR